MKTKKTITDSTVDPDILAYTVGDYPVLDLATLIQYSIRISTQFNRER